MSPSSAETFTLARSGMHAPPNYRTSHLNRNPRKARKCLRMTAGIMRWATPSVNTNEDTPLKRLYPR